MTYVCDDGGDTTDRLAASPAEALTARVVRAGLIAILRSRTAEHYPALCATLAESGVRVVEVTLTADDSLAAVGQLAREYAGSDVLVGAGTVVTGEQAEACIEAGAEFLVSPAFTAEVLAVGRAAGVAVYPGALTPTEILTAHRGGASAVKLFPSSAVSPRYLRDVHAPMPDITLIPTGGVEIDTIGLWLAAGAGAVGLSSPLLGRAVTEGPDAALTDRARRAVAAVAAAREGA